MPNTPIPATASIKVRLVKLGQRRLGLSILEQTGIPNSFIRERADPRTGNNYTVYHQDEMELQDRILYLRGRGARQPEYVTYLYESAPQRDNAYRNFIAILTEINGGRDPRVEAQPPTPTVPQMTAEAAAHAFLDAGIAALGSLSGQVNNTTLPTP